MHHEDERTCNITSPNFCDSMLKGGKVINFKNPCENNLNYSSMLKLKAKHDTTHIRNHKTELNN